jgi:hypothetical protein
VADETTDLTPGQQAYLDILAKEETAVAVVGPVVSHVIVPNPHPEDGRPFLVRATVRDSRNGQEAWFDLWPPLSPDEQAEADAAVAAEHEAAAEAAAKEAAARDADLAEQVRVAEEARAAEEAAAEAQRTKVVQDMLAEQAATQEDRLRAIVKDEMAKGAGKPS